MALPRTSIRFALRKLRPTTNLISVRLDNKGQGLGTALTRRPLIRPFVNKELTPGDLPGVGERSFVFAT
jgi:hypothetical protein